MNKWKEFLQINIDLILVNLFFTFTIFIFAPIDSFMTNINEFSFGLSNVILGFLIFFIVSFIALSVIGLIFKGNIRKKYTYFIFGLALAFYIQGNFMNFNLNVLDGREINWQDYRVWTIVNILIWIVLMALPFILASIKKFPIKKIIKIFSLLIILVQMVTIIILLIASPKNPNVNFYLSDEGKFSLSTNDNVVVFILDAFDSLFFDEIMNDSLEFREKFKDFTYFRNMISTFPSTKPSIPLILTGISYDNTVEYNNYIQQAFTNSELWNQIEKNNYDSRVFASPNFIIKDYNKIKNLKLETHNNKSLMKSFNSLFKMTIGKYVPYTLKQYFLSYENTNTIELNMEKEEIFPSYENVKFYNDLMETGITTFSESNAIRFYHIYATHQPYHMNEKIEIIPEGTDVIQQAKGCLNIVNKYIDFLKKEDIYDKTMVVILADHASYGNGRNPLLLVKDKEKSQEEMKISNAPIMQEDMVQTIALRINQNSSNSEKTIFDYNENEKRERRVRYYTWDDSWNKAYLPNMTEYIVLGSPDKGFSYHETGIFYTNQGIKSAQYVDYNIGDQLKFGKNGRGNKFINSSTEQFETVDTTWILDGNVTFLMNLNGFKSNDLILKIELSNIYYNETDGIEVAINGKNFAFNKKEKDLIFYIKSSDIKENRLNFSIYSAWDKRVNLKELGLSKISGDFSFGIKSISILDDIIDLSTKDFRIDFVLGGNSENFITDGWSVQEAEHRWTTTSAGVKVNLPNEKNIVMELDYFKSNVESKDSINLNGVKIDESQLTRTENGTIVRALLKSEQLNSGAQTLELITSLPTPPSERDPRYLGLAFKKILFYYENER